MPPAHDPFSLDNQRRLCHEAAERNGERIQPEFEFQELDVSGRKDRPRRGLDDALSLLLTRKMQDAVCRQARPAHPARHGTRRPDPR
jgi:hypothetical protein